MPARHDCVGSRFFPFACLYSVFTLTIARLNDDDDEANGGKKSLYNSASALSHTLKFDLRMK